MDFKIYLSRVQASDWEVVIQLQFAEDFLLQSYVNEKEIIHARLL